MHYILHTFLYNLIHTYRFVGLQRFVVFFFLMLPRNMLHQKEEFRVNPSLNFAFCSVATIHTHTYIHTHALTH